MNLAEILEKYGETFTTVIGKGVAYGLQKALEELSEKVKESNETFDDKISVEIAKVIVDELNGFIASLDNK